MRELLRRLTDSSWWRALEGIHTIAWIVGGAGAFTTFIVGLAERIPWFWLISIPPILLAAVVFLFEEAYWRFGYCPLRVAAVRTYDELKDITGIGAVSRALAGAKDEHVLDEVGTAIAQEVPIFGRRPPATRREQVPTGFLSQAGIVDGASKIRRHNSRTFEYVDLEIQRAHVRRAIKVIGANWSTLAKKK